MGQTTFKSWQELKKELSEQFLHCNTLWEAWVALKKLKHTRTILDCMMEFILLSLNVKDMFEEEKLFNFLTCLQNWAQTEVRWHGAKDLLSVIATAKALLDLRLSTAQEIDKSKSCTKEKKFGKTTFKKEVTRKSIAVKP